MTDLIFIRHGETDWNRQQRFQGQIDVPLNATGHLQAQRLARPARVQADWREQGFGVLEGLSVDEIKEHHPDLWAQWLRHDADYCLPAGESVRRFHARVVDAVRELARQHEGRRVLIVTHGGVLDMLWRTVHGHPLHGPRDCAIPNTGINRLRWRDGRLDLEHWADDAHLAGLPEQPATGS